MILRVYSVYTLYIRGVDMSEEKEVQFAIRVPKDLKDGFVESCKSQDTTASRELRRFMNEYVKKHGQKRLF